MSLALVPACSSLPGLDEPQLKVAPYYAAYESSGHSRMQSNSAGPRGQRLDLSEMGLGDRGDDWGITAFFGEQQSGFRFDYLRLDSDLARSSTLEHDYGVLTGGSTVFAKVKMNEYRLAYMAELFRHTNEEETGWIGFSAGLSLEHRNIKLGFREDGGALAQKTQIQDDGVPYLRLGLAAGWNHLTGRLGFGYNDSVGWSSDTGVYEDYEARVDYYLEDQDITLFAGYRQSRIPGQGFENGLYHDTTFELSGFFVGVEFGF